MKRSTQTNVAGHEDISAEWVNSFFRTDAVLAGKLEYMAAAKTTSDENLLAQTRADTDDGVVQTSTRKRRRLTSAYEAFMFEQLKDGVPMATASAAWAASSLEAKEQY